MASTTAHVTAHAESATTFFGLIAEFETPTALLAAANKARLEGFRHMDAYSPIPIEGLPEALGLGRTTIPLITLIGGILGGLGGYSLQYWTQVVAYPMNIGGRPFHSWPHFIPVTFETTVLGAALACFVGMWVLNKMPQPYHPVFNVPAFARASLDRFFLCIESTDGRFDQHSTKKFLESLHPVGVYEVAP